MARSRVKVEDDELEELEELEDLEDEADVVEAVEDDDEDEEEEDEAPRRKRKSKKSKAREDGSITSREFAEALGTTSKNLRVMLRDRGIKKGETGRYEWASLEAALEQLGFEDVEEAKDAMKEARNARLDVLKESQAEKRAAAAKGKKKKAEPEPEDEDDEDEDEEEEAPVAKKRTRRK